MDNKLYSGKINELKNNNGEILKHGKKKIFCMESFKKING